MALIKCPECGRQISDKSTACPYCGLPSEHYVPRNARNNADHLVSTNNDELSGFDAKEFKNALVSFDRDHTVLFSFGHYVAASDLARFVATYGKYQQLLKNGLILQYVRTNAIMLQMTILG